MKENQIARIYPDETPMVRRDRGDRGGRRGILGTCRVAWIVDEIPSRRDDRGEIT